jgi:hypothetical protein
MNRVIRVEFVLPGLQSGRVRVTCFNPISNRVGFLSDPIM